MPTEAEAAQPELIPFRPEPPRWGPYTWKWWLGNLPVLFVLFLFGLSMFVFAKRVCIDDLWKTYHFGVLCIALLVFYALFLSLSTVSLLQCLFVDPGGVPETYTPESQLTALINEGDTAHPTSPSLVSIEVRCNDGSIVQVPVGSAKLCRKCNRLKPPRAHHCSICEKCILRMDHHCPWINNCVGFYNYKCFVLFVGYTCLLCLTVFAGTSFRFYQTGVNFTGNQFVTEFLVGIVWLLSTCFAVTLFGFFMTHAMFIFKNTTTIETIAHDQNRYDSGAFSNFKEIFGTSPLLWALPVVNVEGDGCYNHFPVTSV